MANSKTRVNNLLPIYYIASSGNVKLALEKLHSLNIPILSKKEQLIQSKYIERFENNNLATQLTQIYENYWRLVLLQTLTMEEGYKYLFTNLTPIIKNLGGSINEFSESEYDRISAFLTEKLKELGFYSKIGVVSPHLNLMIWKKENSKNFTVNLGDSNIQSIKVILMDNFITLGWAAYATFNKIHVGGWVSDNALYCVASSYDLNSENFKVSFLVHEARHFADLKKFPNLSSIDLEYRAKLNELIVANKTLPKLLDKFFNEQKNDKSNPHSYASFLLINNLSNKTSSPLTPKNITKLPKKQIQKYASELLTDHTKQLNLSP